MSLPHDTLTQRFASLFHFEKLVLLAALQRDINNELEKIKTDPHWADFHRYNVLVGQRILSTLSPMQ